MSRHRHHGTDWGGAITASIVGEAREKKAETLHTPPDWFGKRPGEHPMLPLKPPGKR